MDTPDAPVGLADCVVTLADIPETPPCCRAAAERGYRRGYKDGYTYAFCDAGGTLSETIWERFWRFRAAVVLPWMWRAWQSAVPRENGPRFRPAVKQRHPERY
jgi:hypothetical protein